MPSPIDPLWTVQELLRKQAKLLGLEMYHAIWVPGDRGDNTIIQAYFRITPEAVLNDDERTDKEFDKLMEGFGEEDPNVDPMDELKKKLVEDFKSGKGFLGKPPEQT